MIRVRRWVAAAVLGGAVAPITACNQSGSLADGGSGRPAVPATAADIGGPLYAAVPAPKLPDMAGPAAEPIVVPNAVVQNNEKVQIAAKVDGEIELLAVPLEPNERVAPDRITFHPRAEKKDQPFRKLVVGDTIKRGQYVARLDDQVTLVQVEGLRNTIVQLKAAIEAAIEAEKATQKQVDAYKDLPGIGGVEKLSNIALVARYRENRLQSMKELAKTESDLLQAEAQTRRFWVESPINGRIMKLLKNQGEFAKAGDPILEVQGTDRVRIEGKLDIGYSEVVRPGMRVLVEPSRPAWTTRPSSGSRPAAAPAAPGWRTRPRCGAWPPPAAG